MSIAAHAWYDLPWSDWVGVVGFPLGLFGLWLTFKQASDAKDAAASANTAIRRTQSQIRANQLLVLIPQLRWIASELDFAIDESNERLARRHLDSWRWQANNIHGMLTSADSSQRRILKSLQESVGQAASAGTLLMGKNLKGESVLDRCDKARESIGRVCDQLSAWAGENVTQVTGEDENG
ncbi:hypothetical protein NMK34_29450 [Micromonospora sp. BRA006-A]|uniref:hypothetical protein n=1 Tax=Micromonospora sp. BRA006-A TaxID=2962860 RepID=UPI00296E9B7A|nr:hypothetical protein [Micromonospora sp. BRA006-A]MDW3850744.1 hypothetical protein [Micromonospora sp. BRA006-A]